MVQGWHNAPARQIVIVLSGVLEVGTSDKQTRQWRAGEAFLDAFIAFATNADYVAGLGHRIAALEDSRLLPLTELPIPRLAGR